MKQSPRQQHKHHCFHPLASSPISFTGTKKIWPLSYLELSLHHQGQNPAIEAPILRIQSTFCPILFRSWQRSRAVYVERHDSSDGDEDGGILISIWWIRCLTFGIDMKSVDVNTRNQSVMRDQSQPDKV